MHAAGTQRRALRVVSLTLGIAAGSVSSCVLAQPSTASVGGMPDTAVFAHATPVSDQVLSAQRGRYVDSGKIIGLGVSMVSTWTRPSGQQLTAEAHLAIQLGKGRPRAVFTPSLSIVNGAGNGHVSTTNGTVHGGGFTHINGVAQVIQVAGNDNSVANHAGVSIVTGDMDMPAGNGVSADAGSRHQGDVAMSWGLNHQGLGVTIDVPDVGHVKQQVGNNMLQLAQTAASHQTIRNSLQIHMHVRSLDDLKVQGNISRALQTLHGIPHQ